MGQCTPKCVAQRLQAAEQAFAALCSADDPEFQHDIDTLDAAISRANKELDL